ncbi:glutamate racemase [Lachnospiraceae bacterium RM5]|nr:glutamate racemase [Lachnospiraceae bacterium RM5]
MCENVNGKVNEKIISDVNLDVNSDMNLYGNLDKRSPVGVFDSGVGGLTVVREIMRQLPNEMMVYFGDTARVPYGSKSKKTIIKYSRQIINFLKTKNVKAIVVACNTASALALDEIKDEIDIPIIGVVKPGAKMAATYSKNKRVGVIATEATINSDMYTDVIRSYDKDIKVFGKACPLFVPLVEEGWTKDPVTYEVARRYLKDMKEKDIDTLVLGCTHYPLLRKLVGEVMGDKVTLVNPAYETAVSLGKMLEKYGLLSDNDNSYKGGMYEFYVSDAATKFKDFANSILPFRIDNIDEISIEKY